MKHQIMTTFFRDVGGKHKHERACDWDELADHIRHPQQFESKSDCPMIKLAEFGNRRTENGCLRHDANIEQITGLEGDYDGEQVSVAQAAMMLSEHGIEAVLYTSGSHTPETPRWRV